MYFSGQDGHSNPEVPLPTLLGDICRIAQSKTSNLTDSIVIAGFVEFSKCTFNALCRAPIFNQNLREDRENNMVTFSRSDKPVKGFIMGVVVTGVLNKERMQRCPNVRHFVFDGSAGAVMKSKGHSMHVHILELKETSVPVTNMNVNEICPELVEGVWHLVTTDSVVASGLDVFKLEVYSLKDEDIEPLVFE